MQNITAVGNGFGAIEEGEEDLCRALWISVIVQTFVDAGGKSGKSRSQQEAIRAKAWLSAESHESEFAIICDLADLPFAKTRGRLLEMLENEHETLDFRCLTKAWGKSQTPENRNRFFTRARRNAKLRQLAYEKAAAIVELRNIASDIDEAGSRELESVGFSSPC